MKNGKIRELHKKQIETLNTQIKELKQENNFLTERNSSLNKELDLNKQKVLNLTNIIQDIKFEYEKSIKDLKELKNRYMELIKDVSNERKKFKKESSALLKEIYKK